MPTVSKVYLGSLQLLGGGDSYRSSATYTRPAEWLPLPTAEPNEIRALHAVFDTTENFCTVRMTTTDASSYFIDWGDGVVEAAASNTIRTHVYDYSNSSLDSSTVAKFGYKQCLVRVYPQAGRTFSRMDLGIKVSSPTGLQVYSSGWLDININLPNLAAGANLILGSSAIRHGFLERVNITSWGAVTSFSNLFRNCHRLRSINEHEWDTSSITNFNAVFFACWALTSLDFSGWNTANVSNFVDMFRDAIAVEKIKWPAQFVTQTATNLTNMFYGARSLQEIECSNWDTRNTTSFVFLFGICTSLATVDVSNWNTAKVTTASNMFDGCISLQSVKLTNWSLPLCTNMTNMFSSCFNLREVNDGCDVSAVTAFGTAFASNCNSMSKMTFTGMSANLTVANGCLSAAALNQIYTNLGTVAVARTITVSGNYGTASDNPSIATAKGWTVTG